MVFDLTQRGSFNNVENWLNEVRANTSSNIVVVLVGNKNDKEEELDN